MSSIREKLRAEDIICLFCKNKMQKSNVPGGPLDTDVFVCPVCGFVVHFVGTHMGYYYGVRMVQNLKTENNE